MERYAIDCKSEDLQTEKEKYEALEHEWDEKVQEAYQGSYLLTYLYGRHFKKLLDYLQKSKKVASQEGQSILRYIFGERYKTLEFDDFPFENPKHDVLLPDLGEYLESKANLRDSMKLLSSPNSVLANPNSIRTKILVVSSAANLIENTCTLYLHKTDMLPNLCSCLYCHKGTSVEEIYAFVRRYLQCPGKSLFTVLRIEELDTSSQEAFIKYLAQHDQSGKKIYSQLAILIADIDAPIAKQLKTLGFSLENVKAYDENALDKYFQERLPSKVHIVTSERAGMGKTQWISQKNASECFFPVSGVVSFRNILKRLIKLDLPEKSSLHIDIGLITDDESRTELNRVLFSLLILGGLSSFEHVFTLPEGCEVYIELHEPNPKPPLLRLLKSNEVKRDKLRRIKLPLMPTSRIVFSLLSLFDKEELHKKDFATFNVKDCKVEEPESQQLLEKYFLKHVDAPNFYKIKVFLQLAANLLSQFTQSIFFTNSSLSHAGVDKKFKNIVFEGIIQYSREYTIRSIDAAMEGQKKALMNEQMIEGTEDFLGF